MIVKNYIDEASESKESEEEFMELAHKVSANFAKSISEKLWQRREWWRTHGN